MRRQFSMIVLLLVVAPLTYTRQVTTSAASLAFPSDSDTVLASPAVKTEDEDFRPSWPFFEDIRARRHKLPTPRAAQNFESQIELNNVI